MSRVLIVDDDRAIRELLRFALECEGYDVLLLEDGEGVVELLAGMAEPCVILMDLMMPRVDGWEVCRRLTQQRGVLARHRLVVMTASMLSNDLPPAPATALLRKPFELEQMLALVAGLALAARDVTTAVMVSGGSVALTEIRM